MAGFIGVHLGAGNYSESEERNYKKLCRSACRKGSATLLSGGSALDAAVAATMILESSALTNAGFGSNLNIDGNVEVDAGIMEGKKLTFGGIGAAPGMKHPILVASELCKNQQGGPLTPSGLIAPNLIVGPGATIWAEEAGIKDALSLSLISERAKRKFQHNKRKVEKLKKRVNTELVHLQTDKMNPLDTVGVVVVDKTGHVVATCSSGGISLKHSGRIGQAPIFGAGCWAEDARTMQENKYIMESIAVSTTGCGEYLVRTSLARELARSCHLSDGSATVPLHAAFTEKYLNSQFLEDVEVSGRLGGAIVLRAIGPTDCLEFLWAHSTKSMCIGYMMANSESKPKSHISQLPKGSMIGSKVTVEGISMEFSSKDC